MNNALDNVARGYNMELRGNYVSEQFNNLIMDMYGILKPSDKYLRFVFLTGVTKFSHVSIFSDLNHLTDLTLDPRYADICGITQEELENNFGPEINTVLEVTGGSREDYLENCVTFTTVTVFQKSH